MVRKVIIVAPKQVTEFLQIEFAEEWDTQITCENIEYMWYHLYTGALSDESEIVCIVDDLFDENHESFAEAVAMLAPEALVMILAYENKEEVIRAKVREFAQVHSLPSAPFYFIRAATALYEIEETISKRERTSATKVFNLNDEAVKKIHASRKDEVIASDSAGDETEKRIATVHESTGIAISTSDSKQ